MRAPYIFLLSLIQLVAVTLIPAEETIPGYALLPNEATAERAAELLREGSRIRLFCDPCGDNYVQEVRVTSVTVAEHPEERNRRWVLRVNGDLFPIEEIYLRVDGEWRSLAHMLGIADKEIPETIFPFLRAQPIPPRE